MNLHQVFWYNKVKAKDTNHFWKPNKQKIAHPSSLPIQCLRLQGLLHQDTQEEL